MDAALLEADVLAAQRGDREAFSRLVDAYRALVSSIAAAILGDLEAGEDVAQEVFLAAWRGMGTLRSPHSFAPWLRQVTRNQARMAARARRRRRVADDEQLLASVADPAPGAREQLVSDEERAMLAAVLDDMPDDAREIVTLYYREGRSTRQVASLLDLGEDAVKKRLERARAAIRREMLERFGETVRRTAPGAAFTAAVAAALAVAAPGTASAATIGTGAAIKGGGSKLAAALGGAGLGVAGGLLGVVLRFRPRIARARDENERRALRRLSLVAGAVVVLLAAGIQVSVWLKSPILLIAVWLLAVAVFLDIFLRRLPRFSAPRHRRERLGTWFGLAVGITGGTAAVAWAAYRLWRGG